ncbi:unnamed protein product [Linum tenue]|uniref:Senescence regulator n=1 Tax=Linum tenue TaxID=586396 RepID=A0AAV0PDE9_9ROSI|nr:unnamed protein product [Linum tenue]
MADWYTRRNGDFEEADIWSFAKQSEPTSAASKQNRKSSVSSSAARRGTTAPRAIPSEIPGEGNSTPVMAHRSSAPMNIPDWSKIYGANNGGYYDDYQNNDDAHYDDDDDDDDDVVPPHEWLAKKLARSQISSFSVCEGIGRTLKGRDLSKVRNAILTKTGFLE